MVEQLKKDDIISFDDFQKQYPISDVTDEGFEKAMRDRKFVEVSRIKEIVKDIIGFDLKTNDKTELTCKIINMFGVLFDTQSPPELLQGKDKPPRDTSGSAESKPVGVSFFNNIRTFCLDCGCPPIEHYTDGTGCSYHNCQCKGWR